MFKHSLIFHFSVDGSIASGGQGNVAFAFKNNSAVIEESRNAALREEDNGILVVSEIVIGGKIIYYLLVIHLASHQIPLY